MKVRIINLLRHTISLALVAGLAYYLYKNWDVFRVSADISWLHILVIFVCVLLTWVVNSFKSLILLRMEKIPVTFLEILLIQSASHLGNYLPMRAGSLLRFYYFKKIHRLEFSRLGGLTALRLLILIAATGMMGCIGLAGLWGNNLPGTIFLWTLFFSMLCAPVITWFLPIHKVDCPDTRFGRLTNTFLSGFITIKAQPRMAALIFGLTLCQFAILSLRLLVSFDAIQVFMSPWVLMILAPSVILISFVSITPGNLGLREWFIGFISLAAGYQLESAIFASTLDHAVILGVSFTFGGISTWLVWLRLQREAKKPHSIISE
jgi:hypothetical protein